MLLTLTLLYHLHRSAWYIQLHVSTQNAQKDNSTNTFLFKSDGLINLFGEDIVLWLLFYVVSYKIGREVC